MDGPNVHASHVAVNLRRRNSLPSLRTLRRRSTLLRSSSPSSKSLEPQFSYSFRAVKLNKSNPYVGWFRHAPPTDLRNVQVFATANVANFKNADSRLSPWPTAVATNAVSRTTDKLPWSLGDSSLENSDSSFTRQLLCSVLALIQQQDQFKALSKKYKSKRKQAFQKMHLQTSNEELHSWISGHLRGGCPLDQDQQQEHSHMESATVKIISRLACWFLQLDQGLPFQSDEHVLIPKIREQTREEAAANRDCESSISSFEEEDDDEHSQDSSSYDNYDTAFGSRAVTESHTFPPPSVVMTNNQNQHPNLQNQHALFETSSSLSILSSQAEAYYAQTAIANQLEASTGNLMPNTPTFTRNRPRSTSDVGIPTLTPAAHVMDYETITQMDIVRMTRMASRHLDVHSILQLPTRTYWKHDEQETDNHDSSSNHRENDGRSKKQENSNQEGKTKSPGTHRSNKQRPHSENNKTPPEFSWMMVHKEENTTGSHDDDSSTISSDDIDSNDQSLKSLGIGKDCRLTTKRICSKEDICVICLEQFVNGDRLRVLPCQHSFHVGCIDRWLSGSHSFQECFTAGCPTCKKHPSSCQPAMNTAKDDDSSSSSLSHSCTGKKKDRRRKDYMNESADGSVPSWAFARIGDALSRESRHFL
jgi:hypothetical protein